MEIESRADTLTLPKARAEALLAAGDYGLKLIEALNHVQRPASTEYALNQVRAQIGKARGKTVEITLTRGDASLVALAVEIGEKGAEAGTPAEPAPHELRTLRKAIASVDTPDPKNLIAVGRRARR